MEAPGEPNEPAPVSGICTRGICLGVVSALDSTVLLRALPVAEVAVEVVAEEEVEVVVGLVVAGLVVVERAPLGALEGLELMAALGAEVKCD